MNIILTNSNLMYYNFFMSQQEKSNCLTIETHADDRNSCKTCSTLSQVTEYSPNERLFIPEPPHKFRFQLFEASSEGAQISQKLNQRVVSWMITVCWSKNISQQCLWSTLLLYYTCKAKRIIKKQELELTLLTCLGLSLKMSSSKSYHPRELAALSSKQIKAIDIITMQQQILELIDYNLVIPHQLCEVMHECHFGEDRRHEILMICELLMIKDYNIFLNRSRLQCIVKMLGGEEVQKLVKEDLLQQIGDLLQLKQCKIIFNKYSSKIDTEILKARFL